MTTIVVLDDDTAQQVDVLLAELEQRERGAFGAPLPETERTRAAWRAAYAEAGDLASASDDQLAAMGLNRRCSVYYEIRRPHEDGTYSYAHGWSEADEPQAAAHLARAQQSPGWRDGAELVVRRRHSLSSVEATWDDDEVVATFEPSMHSVRCRCDGRGIVPAFPGIPGGGVKPCPETEPK